MAIYPFGAPARGQGFIGRDALVAAALDQPWVWLCGQRRIGKSSALNALVERARERGLFALPLDLALAEDAEDLRIALLDELDLVGAPPGVDPGAPTYREGGPARGIARLARDLTAAGAPVLFAWDEAERLIGFERGSPGFVDMLAARLARIPNLRFALAGTQLLSGLVDLDRPVADFLPRFAWIPLGGLDDESATQLLRAEHLDAWQPALDDGLAARVVSWSGGHPWILQGVGSRLALRAGRRVGSPLDGAAVTLAVLGECFEELLANEALTHTLTDDFLKLTALQQRVVRELGAATEALAPGVLAQRCGAELPAVRRACTILQSYGYVELSPLARLRFRFYKSVLPTMAADTRVAAENLEKSLRRDVVVVAAHTDAAYADRLVGALERHAAVHHAGVWTEGRMRGEPDWSAGLDAALERSGLVVLLLSQDLVAIPALRDTILPRIHRVARAGHLELVTLATRALAPGQQLTVDGEGWVPGDATPLDPGGEPLGYLADEASLQAALLRAAEAAAEHLQGAHPIRLGDPAPSPAPGV
jgi:hypothetical protein